MVHVQKLWSCQISSATPSVQVRTCAARATLSGAWHGRCPKTDFQSGGIGIVDVQKLEWLRYGYWADMSSSMIHLQLLALLDLSNLHRATCRSMENLRRETCREQRSRETCSVNLHRDHYHPFSASRWMLSMPGMRRFFCGGSVLEPPNCRRR